MARPATSARPAAGFPVQQTTPVFNLLGPKPSDGLAGVTGAAAAAGPAAPGPGAAGQALPQLAPDSTPPAADDVEPLPRFKTWAEAMAFLAPYDVDPTTAAAAAGCNPASIAAGAAPAANCAVRWGPADRCHHACSSSCCRMSQAAVHASRHTPPCHPLCSPPSGPTFTTAGLQGVCGFAAVVGEHADLHASKSSARRRRLPTPSCGPGLTRLPHSWPAVLQQQAGNPHVLEVLRCSGVHASATFLPRAPAAGAHPRWDALPPPPITVSQKNARLGCFMDTVLNRVIRPARQCRGDWCVHCRARAAGQQ